MTWRTFAPFRNGDEEARTYLDKLAKAYLIDQGSHFRLKDFDPADTGMFEAKEQAAVALQEGTSRLIALQDQLFAQECWAVFFLSFRAWMLQEKIAPLNT